MGDGYSVVTRLLVTTALIGVACAAPYAIALPVGGSIAEGQAVIAGSGNTLNIDQSTSRAIINWQSFNVGSGEIVNFNQPSASSITLNRVTGDQNRSEILGTLTANGQVWLVNPNGVIFGRGAQVNVGSLLATASDIGNANFMAGDYVFDTQGNPSATISNAGTIHIADGGLAAMVGPNVTNDGMIEAKLGKIQLASGDTFTLDLYGDGLINLQASPALTQQLVDTSGIITADGGEIMLTTAAAENTVNSLINMNGLIQANSVGSKNGHIVLYAAGSNAVPGNATAQKGLAQGNSNVQVSGTLSASGKVVGQAGGEIDVLGDNVSLLSGSLLNASGDAGGGNIKIGGDFHGAGTTPTALNTTVDANSLILANAITSGNGGSVAVWSDEATQMDGNISARGGAQGGNGGFVETSSHDLLGLSGSVDASAPNGNAGSWLLDPSDVNISGVGRNSVSSSGGTANPSSDSYTILDSSIATALNNGNNVTITTTNGGGAQTGNITVGGANAANISWSTDNLLLLSAAGSITINANATLTNTYSGTFGSTAIPVVLALRADNAGAVNGSGVSTNSYGVSNAGLIDMSGSKGAVSSFYDSTGTYSLGVLNTNYKVNGRLGGSGQCQRIEPVHRLPAHQWRRRPRRDDLIGHLRAGRKHFRRRRGV